MTHECLIEFPFLGVPSRPKQNVLKAEIGQETEQKIWTRNRKFGRNLCKLYNILICTYVYIYIYTYTIPIYWKISTLTKNIKKCKRKGHRWTNTVQIFNPCTCWQPERSHSCWSNFRCCHHPPILPKLRPTFQAKMGTNRGLSSDGSFKTS